jgi:hypothetical protein
MYLIEQQTTEEDGQIQHQMHWNWLHHWLHSCLIASWSLPVVHIRLNKSLM